MDYGYWPINPTVLNPHFGTEEQLKEMLEEAHKRNINVIVDYVANHLHQSSPILKEHPDWVTPMYTEDGRLNVRLFDDERLTTWFDTFLPTLDLEKEEVREAMTDSALYWIRHYDFDGFKTILQSIFQNIIGDNLQRKYQKKEQSGTDGSSSVLSVFSL